MQREHTPLWEKIGAWGGCDQNRRIFSRLALGNALYIVVTTSFGHEDRRMNESEGGIAERRLTFESSTNVLERDLVGDIIQ
jgi:hypothetical protein